LRISVAKRTRSTSSASWRWASSSQKRRCTRSKMTSLCQSVSSASKPMAKALLMPPSRCAGGGEGKPAQTPRATSRPAANRLASALAPPRALAHKRFTHGRIESAAQQPRRLLLVHRRPPPRRLQAEPIRPHHPPFLPAPRTPHRPDLRRRDRQDRRPPLAVARCF